MERLAMEQINKNLGEIRAEYFKNRDFIGRGFKQPPEFELKGYDDEPTPAPRTAAAKAPEEPQASTQDPAPGQSTEETAIEPDNTQPEAPRVPAPATQAPAPEQTLANVPKMLSRLSNGLNGPNWSIGPLSSRRRYVTALLDFYQTPGTHRGTHLNTEEVPDEKLNPGPRHPKTPRQEEP